MPRRPCRCRRKESPYDKSRSVYPLRRFCPSGPRYRGHLHRRLRPRGRDGRSVRAQHLHRHPRGEVHSPHHHPAAGRPPDDRPPHPLRRTVLRCRRRPHHLSRGGGHRGEHPRRHRQDPRQGQKGRRGHQAQNPCQRRAALHRQGGADPGDDGGAGLRRPEVHGRHDAQGPDRPGLYRCPEPRLRAGGGRRRGRPDLQALHRRRRQRAGGRFLRV